MCALVAMVKKKRKKKRRREGKGLRSETSGTRRSATLLANDRRSRADSGNVRKNGLWIFLCRSAADKWCANLETRWCRDAMRHRLSNKVRAGAPLPSPGICFIARFIIFRTYRIRLCDSARHRIHFASPLSFDRDKDSKSGLVTSRINSRVAWRYRTSLETWAIFNSDGNISRYVWKILFFRRRDKRENPIIYWLFLINESFGQSLGQFFRLKSLNLSYEWTKINSYRTDLFQNL